MGWTQEELDSLFTQAKKRVMTDRAFRELLIASPHQAVEQMSGKRVPAGLKIKVLESDSNYHLTFVLPRYVGDELSSGELKLVAGGICSTDNPYGPQPGRY